MSDDVFNDHGGEIMSDPGRSTPDVRHSEVTEDLGEIFGLLRSARRRYLLYHLYGHEAEVTDSDDAIDAVCAYEKLGGERDGFPPREQVRIDLHHAQFPLLEDAGIIDYDPRQETIRYRGSASLEEWLEYSRHVELD